MKTKEEAEEMQCNANIEECESQKHKQHKHKHNKTKQNRTEGIKLSTDKK